MKEILIDCSRITSPERLHQVLRDALGFPEWYGNNLDALHDCLTSITEETELVLEHFLGLGDFAPPFLRVFADSSQDNPTLTITIR